MSKSELERLETCYAPCMTLSQVQNRCLVLETNLTAMWDFVHFMNKLDPAMRMALLNYLHTSADSVTQSEDYEDHSDFDLSLDASDGLAHNRSAHSPVNTQSLSPKKRRKKSKKPVLSF